MTTLLVAATLAATALLVAAERRDSAAARWILKPIASSGFVATAVAAGALETGYGRALVVALALCWLGDVLLIPEDEHALSAGIASFLAGHLALVAAFLVRGIDVRSAALAAFVLSAPAFVVLRWLAPHLPPGMRPAVIAYVAVISLMVASAIGTHVDQPSWRIVAAAIAFMVSDLSVARDRFVARAFVNRAWGLPLYYAAVLLFATTASP